MGPVKKFGFLRVAYAPFFTAYPGFTREVKSYLLDRKTPPALWIRLEISSISVALFSQLSGLAIVPSGFSKFIMMFQALSLKENKKIIGQI